MDRNLRIEQASFGNDAQEPEFGQDDRIPQDFGAERKFLIGPNPQDEG
jgi:hypothetical protein